MTDDIDLPAICRAIGWNMFDGRALTQSDPAQLAAGSIAALDATGHDYDYQHIRSEGVHRVRIFGLPGGLGDYPKGEGDNLREAACRALTAWARAMEARDD